MAYSEVREHNPKVEFGVDDPNNNGVGRRKSLLASRWSPKRTAFKIRNGALFGRLANEERAQIDDAAEVKVAKRRPKNERKQSLKAK